MQIASAIMARIRAESAEYEDFAILYRTNSQSRALEEQLRRRNIPYMIYSGNSFFERAEVKDMMAYFKLAVNLNDDESFRRVVNKPARGIGDTSLNALTQAAREQQVSLFKAASLPNLENFGLKAAAIGKIRSFCTLMEKRRRKRWRGMRTMWLCPLLPRAGSSFSTRPIIPWRGSPVSRTWRNC